MHYRTLAILFTFLGASCQCLAIPLSYTSSQNQTVYGIAPQAEGGETYVVTSSTNSIKHELGTSSEPVGAIAFPTSSSSSLSPSMAHSPSPATSPRTWVIASTLPRSSSRPLHVQVMVAYNEQHRHRRRDRNTMRQSPIAVAFEFLGGLAGVAVLILCGRSVHSYYRTPRRDLLSDHIDRYNLERELAELEEARLRENYPPRKPSFHYPPPAYQQAPKYEGVTKHAPSAVAALPQ